MVVFIVDNQLHFIGYVDESSVKEITDQVELLISHPSDYIEFHISSPGGSTRNAETIIYMLSTCGKSIHTYIHRTEYYTGVASAASVIVASVSHIKHIDSNATFLIHHARSTSGPVEDVDDIHFWLQQTDFDYETINELIKAETLLDANAALALKFVDDVLVVE